MPPVKGQPSHAGYPADRYRQGYGLPGGPNHPVQKRCAVALLWRGDPGPDRRGKRFSEKRLRELLSSREYESVQHIVRSAVSEVTKTTGAADQVEDMTLLAV